MKGWTKERVAVAGYFALLGIVCSAWVSSIDDLKILLGLDDAQLGQLLFCGPLGNLVSFTFASRLIAKLGSRRGTVFVAPFYLLAAAGLGLCYVFKAPWWYWGLSLAVFGGTGNLVNISMNTQAGIVEKRSGRNIMNSFHALFSLFFLLGVLLAMGAQSLSVPVGGRILATVILGGILHLGVCWFLPGERDEQPADQGSRWHMPDRLLFMIGLSAIVIMGCEGAVNDWVNVFYEANFSKMGMGLDGLRKLGLLAFTIAMVFGRLCANGLVNQFSPGRIFRLYILLSFLGLALSLLSPFLGVSPYVMLTLATIGFAVAGLGISGLVPLLYSKANRTHSMSPSSALTFVGSMGFLGYFFGPPLLGFISRITNLSVALGLFAGLILFCLLLDLDGDVRS